MEDGGELASRSVAAAVDEQSIVLVSKHHVRHSWAWYRRAHEFNVAVGKIPIKLWLASDVMNGSRPLAPLAFVVVALNQVMVI